MDNIRRFNDIIKIYYEVLDSEMKIPEANKATFDKKRSEEDSEWTLMDHEIHFVLLVSRQGKVRLTKWYSPYTQKERSKVIRELSGVILNRGPKLCNFIEWRGYKVVYKRYASLYFCMCIDEADNELEVLEIIHHYVEILDRYFGSDQLVEAAKEEASSISNIIAQATK
ncbi:hypothetical protein Bca101_074969 [Brassica carinata]